MHDLQLGEFVELHPQPAPDAIFIVAPQSRIVVATDSPLAPTNGFWAAPRDEKIGDSPRQYHPKYLMAVLSTGIFPHEAVLPHFPIPIIDFQTDEWTRRSMTLNAMRMTTEFVASGSRRVLELVENRLAAGQADVVHDALVYLMNQVLDAREIEAQERLLRSASLAAFLGLPQNSLDSLFLQSSICATEMMRTIEAGETGIVRRDVAIAPLVENQLQLLEPALRQHAHSEEKLLGLMNEIVALLRSTAPHSSTPAAS